MKTGRPFIDRVIAACEHDLGHELTEAEVWDMLEGLFESMHETLGEDRWEEFFGRRVQ